MMNPLLVEALASIFRWGLALLAGYLVKAGIWDASAAETYVAAAAIALVNLGWSLWQKYRSRIAFLTALDMRSGSTESDVKAVIAAGGGASLNSQGGNS
jgi:hypothetical protein